MLWKDVLGSKTVIIFTFVDDIDAVAEEEQELEDLLDRLDKTSTMYKMEIRAVKTKLMTNTIQREIKVKRQQFGIITSFSYCT